MPLTRAAGQALVGQGTSVCSCTSKPGAPTASQWPFLPTATSLGVQQTLGLWVAETNAEFIPQAGRSGAAAAAAYLKTKHRLQLCPPARLNFI